MADERVEWRPGHEISFWPELKFARAQQHMSDLSSRMLVWGKSTTARTRKVISDDQHEVDVIVEMPASPPLTEFALCVGDAVHNLRAALDSVVWELAHLEGKTPRKPKRVAFPICLEESGWQSAEREFLETVHPVALARIRSVQPFLYEDGSRSALVALHAADIRDKHRTQLACTMTAQAIDFNLSTFKFVDEAEIPDPPFKIDIKGEGDLVDGQTLLSIHSTGRFEAARVPITLNVEIQIETDTGRISLNSLMNGLFGQVRATLDILYYGVEGANERNRAIEGRAAKPNTEDLDTAEEASVFSDDDAAWDAVAVPRDPADRDAGAAGGGALDLK